MKRINKQKCNLKESQVENGDISHWQYSSYKEKVGSFLSGLRLSCTMKVPEWCLQPEIPFLLNFEKPEMVV